ncbi:MAG TPA: hypothetical protein VKD26_14485 [Streptosporangiaceae bacterium]|nr:hypothetical protein [Streptosporangiaceae bacterium]
MYDMYPWNQPADASDKADEAVRAVQVALDRRDNGGDATAHQAPVTAARAPVRGPRGQ